MRSSIFALLNRIDNPNIISAGAIPWGAPVPSFGDSTTATVATLGINPSNREFVDTDGNELDGESRRFHTLRSLKLKSWTDADAHHIELILASCRKYFTGNPYNQWFKILDNIVQATGASYYSTETPACHLDLIPYATSLKWSELTPKQRTILMTSTTDVLGGLIRDSPIRILILNGQSVVNHFEACSGATLKRRLMQDWTLPRRTGKGVVGIAYSGLLHDIAGTPLSRPLNILGFNHNLQSSFGVTKTATSAIKHWLEQAMKATAHDQA